MLWSEALEEYVIAHMDEEGDLLAELNRQTHLLHLRPRMLSGHLQGKVLRMLSQMIRPKRILEIGTFTGYSALCLAEGLQPDGELHTIEINDEMEEFIRSFFARSPYGERMHLHIGDAKTLVPKMDGEFDLVFLDGDKRDYCIDLQNILPRLSLHGYIIADNTLWDGKVAAPVESNDEQTLALQKFNHFVKQSEQLEVVILPIRDGMTIMRKVTED